ncbi:response regulator [Planctobacterium marinum]|uniref:response regulator n=1 Tax=Planctobacterium marinum TaxID=1631968 RepID=UPI001E45EC43|nr:response regulator [Planctobacterium marinum]MCC2606835.1 response regulator [Planctobacterium marinum]
MPRHILIVEDEPDMASMIVKFLEKAGYQASHIDDGLAVLPFIKNQQPDMLLLDLMLPGKDGISICRELRQFSDIPVLMVTAKTSEAERLIGLDIGADDYICKPFSANELVMRVNVYFRRVDGRLANKGLTLNEDTLRISYEGNSIELTAIEFALLKFLHSKPGTIYSRNYIMDNIYRDYRIVSDRTVDSHIRNLRKKLKQLAPEQEFVHSVYGAGYRYSEAE